VIGDKSTANPSLVCSYDRKNGRKISKAGSSETIGIFTGF
jgi:hypothetical protein